MNLQLYRPRKRQCDRPLKRPLECLLKFPIKRPLNLQLWRPLKDPLKHLLMRQLEYLNFKKAIEQDKCARKHVRLKHI